MRLPGWGEPIDIKRDITRDDWHNAIQHELAALLATHDRVAVLAHSLGGCLTTVLAQDQKLPAHALVLYAPMFEVSSARSPLLKTETWFHIGDTLLPETMIIESVFGDHARVHSPRPRTERDPFNPKNIFRILYAEMDYFNAQTPAMNLPVRLVLPGEDRVIETDRSLRWFKDLHAPSKTLHTATAAGHVLPLDMDSLAETDRLVLWFTQQGITP
jgi:alpha-beta hydrolase superfamily lysophospholipase